MKVEISKAQKEVLGANTWFNDEEEIAKYVNDNIDWIKETAKDLHLTIHKDL